MRIGKETGQDIPINIGVPQVDCLSPPLFLLYLANAMEDTRSETEEEHRYAKLTAELEHIQQPHLQAHTYSSYRSITSH